MSVALTYDKPPGCAMPPMLSTVWRVSAQVLLSGEPTPGSIALVKWILDAMPKALPDFKSVYLGPCRRVTLPLFEGCLADEVECAFRREGDSEGHLDLTRRFLLSMTNQIHQVAPEAMVFFGMVYLSHSTVCVHTNINVGWCLPTSLRAKMEPQGFWGGGSTTTVRGSSVPRSHLTPARWRASLRPSHRDMALAKACLAGPVGTEVCNHVLPLLRARRLQQALPSPKVSCSAHEARL